MCIIVLITNIWNIKTWCNLDLKNLHPLILSNIYIFLLCKSGLASDFLKFDFICASCRSELIPEWPESDLQKELF